MRNTRFPKIFIRSKTDFSHHISQPGFTQKEALNLINNVKDNFDGYWKDSGSSDSAKGKYVRDASNSLLGILLHKIDDKILKPHDSMLPKIFFGGVGGSNHKKAVEYLHLRMKGRVLIKLDLSRFFEQISAERVQNFFQYKCACDYKGARMLVDFCCVPVGPKGSGNSRKTIARGFATSPRLAVWCNLDTFIRLERFITKKLKRNNPKIAIYVDDIGISARGISEKEMKNLLPEIENILKSDPHQQLTLNTDKVDVVSQKTGRVEHLGIAVQGNRFFVGAKTRNKIKRTLAKIKRSTLSYDTFVLKKKLSNLNIYKRYIERH